MSDIVFDSMLFDHAQKMAAIKSESERLRITAPERDAIAWASKALCVGWQDLKPKDKDRSRKAAATLASLLDRLG